MSRLHKPTTLVPSSKVWAGIEPAAELGVLSIAKSSTDVSPVKDIFRH